MAFACTLCFPLRGSQVLLGMKKRGFGQGKWNGFGGRVEDSELIEQANVREVREEAGIRLVDFEKAAVLDFAFPFKKEWDQTVHVFVSRKWAGEVAESEEMMPAWFDVDFLPFEQMWDGDAKWLPLVLAGKKVEGRFEFNEDNTTLRHFELREVVAWTR